jgi:hypothetical protein
MEGLRMSRWIGLSVAALVAAMGVVSSARADIIIDVTTTYAVGTPANNHGAYRGSPDTSYVTITAGPSTIFFGTISDIAVSTGAGDFSQSFASSTLSTFTSPFIFTTSPESRGEGGFNGAFGSPQPGIEVLLSGIFCDLVQCLGTIGTPYVLSVNDSQIHSGVFESNCKAISTDTYVLQGGAPTGCDDGGAIATALTPGFTSLIFRIRPCPARSPAPVCPA